jgi:hypothetical protein
VPARVSPVEPIHAEIDQLFADPSRDLAEVVEQVARAGRAAAAADCVGGRGRRVPGPGALPARPRRQPRPSQRPPAADHQDHQRAAHPGAAQAARTDQRFTSQLLVFLGLAPAANKGHDPWSDFLADLTGRGLRSPVLVITDSVPSLFGAVEQTSPAAVACLTSTLDELTFCGSPQSTGSGSAIPTCWSAPLGRPAVAPR